MIDLAYGRLQIHPPEETESEEPIFGVSISKHQNTVELYLNDPYSIEVWVRALKDVCIMTNFHEEYKGLQVLAEGKHTKVRSQYLNLRSNSLLAISCKFKNYQKTLCSESFLKRLP